MADKKASDDAEAKEVQENMDAVLSQGYIGTEIDTTPNENYTVKGVTSGKPTPETDEKQADAVRQAARERQRG